MCSGLGKFFLFKLFLCDKAFFNLGHFEACNMFLGLLKLCKTRIFMKSTKAFPWFCVFKDLKLFKKLFHVNFLKSFWRLFLTFFEIPKLYQAFWVSSPNEKALIKLEKCNFAKGTFKSFLSWKTSNSLDKTTDQLFPHEAHFTIVFSHVWMRMGAPHQKLWCSVTANWKLGQSLVMKLRETKAFFGEQKTTKC